MLMIMAKNNDNQQLHHRQHRCRRNKKQSVGNTFSYAEHLLLQLLILFEVKMPIFYSTVNVKLVLFLHQIILLVECSYSSSYQSKPIPAAITTKRSLNFKDIEIPPNEPHSTNLIEVKGTVPSFTIKFNSASSKVNLFHQHDPPKTPPIVKETYSEDEPHILRQQVKKPIIQEVHEIINPIRHVIQEIKPVEEELSTIVARGSNDSGASLLSAIFSQSNNYQTPKTETAAVVQPNDEYQATNPSNNLRKKPIVVDIATYLLLEKKPDLMINNENELYDNTLYNGSNEYDLKYPSPNSEAKSATSQTTTISHNRGQMYADR